ncbi:MAG: acylphosphatase [Gemmatimonadota bacterium]
MTVRFLVTGRVQGVGYRAFVWSRATALGLSGFALNLPDGRVEVVARGVLAGLESLEKSLQTGPPWSQVVRVVRSEVSDELELPNAFETK